MLPSDAPTIAARQSALRISCLSWHELALAFESSANEERTASQFLAA